MKIAIYGFGNVGKWMCRRLLNAKKFISDISHQIKTPMANLKLYNSTILERELDKETILSFIELMNGQLNKMDFLIQSLIKISRLENGIIHINI